MNKLHTPIKKGWVSSPYGERKGKLHNGVDIAAPAGTPVYAICDGIVVNRFGKNYGNFINLFFSNDDMNKSLYGNQARYAHLQSFNCKNGQSVKRGDVIGYVGTSGNSTGNHLHFEYHDAQTGLQPSGWGYSKWKHGSLDPLKYIEFKLNGEVINPLKEDWRIELGRTALDKLSKDKLVSNPEQYQDKMLEQLPSWVIFVLFDRINDKINNKGDSNELAKQLADVLNKYTK